jgi:hypothetical protein
VALLWQGINQKIWIGRQFCHVTILQGYPPMKICDKATSTTPPTIKGPF